MRQAQPSSYSGPRKGGTVPGVLKRQIREMARSQEVPDLLALFEEATMADNHKQLIAQRIKRLRQQSPYTQEGIADRLHISLRGYQKWEETGGVRFANLEALAALHGVDVSYFYEGEEVRPNSQLDRIESLLSEILDRLGPVSAPTATRAAPAEPEPLPNRQARQPGASTTRRTRSKKSA